MRNDMGVFFLSLSAVGMLMCSLAIPGYAWGELIALVFALIVYNSYKLTKNRRKFLLLCCINLLTGAALSFLPDDPGGGLSGLGVLIALVVIIPTSVILSKIYKDEMRSENKSVP